MRTWVIQLFCIRLLITTLNSLLLTTQGTCCRLITIFNIVIKWRRSEVSNPHALTCTCFQGTGWLAGHNYGRSKTLPPQFFYVRRYSENLLQRVFTVFLPIVFVLTIADFFIKTKITMEMTIRNMEYCSLIIFMENTVILVIGNPCQNRTDSYRMKTYCINHFTNGSYTYTKRGRIHITSLWGK